MSLACLSLELAEQVRLSLLPTVRGPLETLELDLSNLEIVNLATETGASNFGKLDLLVNDAGVMPLPLGTKKNGYKRHFWINHPGHIALMQHLMPLFQCRPSGREVTVASIWQHIAAINFTDLQGQEKYNHRVAYAQSKLTITCHDFELQQRLSAADSMAISLAARPGYDCNNIQAASIQASGCKFEALKDRLARPFLQSAVEGARSPIGAAPSAGA